MLFSSVVFLFYFMPLFFLAYYVLPWKNATLLVGSLLFYSWGEPVYVFLLLFSIVLNHGLGRLMSVYVGQRRRLLILGVSLNVGLLIYFKYLGFLVSNAALAAGLVGWKLGVVPPISLPLGVSFFTFQGISYLTDIYRAKTTPQKSLLSFALYKSMFPQLIAGPIVRYTDVSAQLERRPFDSDKVARGIAIFVIGLSQKVLIANPLAVPADQIFTADAGHLSAGTAWLAALCYTGQIYFDFAGYSNMAIGLGHMLGFTYPENFNRPYASQSITEFWRRWHMSLSTWFRDYLYIPLGGNRGTAAQTYRNLAIVFLICGAWHGASWTFVAWGLYHGMFLIIERAGLGAILAAAPRAVRHLYAMLVVIVGWILFRAHSMAQAGAFMKNMVCGARGADLEMPLSRYFSRHVLVALLIGAACAVIPRPRLGSWFGDPPSVARSRATSPIIAVALAVCLVTSILSLASGTYNPFIYFRF